MWGDSRECSKLLEAGRQSARKEAMTRTESNRACSNPRRRSRSDRGVSYLKTIWMEVGHLLDVELMSE